jgi:hypothetical protein
VLVSHDVAGWLVGLVVGLISVILAALLWSSRQLEDAYSHDAVAGRPHGGSV